MLTIRKNLVIFFLLLIALAGQAQGSFEESYKREVIGFSGDTKFIRDGKVMKRSEVRLLLMKYPESAAEYKLFQKNRRISNALAIASLGFYTGSFLLLSDNPDVAVGALLASSGLAFSTLPFSLRARKNLQQAVYLYNREVLKNACSK